MDNKYTIGLDFGTLSGRALLVRVNDGKEIGSCAVEYPHAVMDDWLETPSGRIKLPPNWALQNPDDYLTVLKSVIRNVLKECSVSPEDVIGIGIDFTTCTLIPVYEDGTPLCMTDRFSSNPHAYVKLWKHHASQKYANMLNEIAAERGEKWLECYGNKISSEWMFPKIWEVLDNAPEVYESADYFIDAADWIVWQLTGRQTRNNVIAGYKAIFREDGYPSNEFFASLDPRLENVIADKCTSRMVQAGSLAGYVTRKASELCGLCEGTAVAAGVPDAHVAAPAVKITKPGQMLAVMGTSTCMLLISDIMKNVPGICGVVRNGIIPGFAGYEAGQGCVGDQFAWFAENCTPYSYKEEADRHGISVLNFLTEKMSALSPGENGLIAIDWWNGNRCLLNDCDLSGLLVGMTLNTKAEEIFRALIESTAFGARMIIENYRNNGIEVNEFRAAGGIARKNPVMMQIYADVLKMDIRLAGSTLSPSLGSAIYAACAAGSEAGGYDDLSEASDKMGSVSDIVYHPIEKNSIIYDRLFDEYVLLHDYFGKSGNDVMKRLLDIKKTSQKRI